jgi:Holliday junction resolvasome RuvABC endonuclease subunit
LPLKRFLWEKNVMSLKLGRRKGVAMAAALERYSVTEYEPKKLKEWLLLMEY